MDDKRVESNSQMGTYELAICSGLRDMSVWRANQWGSKIGCEKEHLLALLSSLPLRLLRDDVRRIGTSCGVNAGFCRWRHLPVNVVSVPWSA
jgi:hypothetical protein